MLPMLFLSLSRSLTAVQHLSDPPYFSMFLGAEADLDQHPGIGHPAVGLALRHNKNSHFGIAGTH